MAGKYAKIVRISGSVHFPGTYPLTEAMSLMDLLCASGGTKDSAYMLDAEISRIVVDQNQVAAIKHIRIDQKMLSENNSSSSFKLLPYDVLSIKPIPLWLKVNLSSFWVNLNFQELILLRRAKN